MLARLYVRLAAAQRSGESLAPVLRAHKPRFDVAWEGIDGTTIPVNVIAASLANDLNAAAFNPRTTEQECQALTARIADMSIMLTLCCSHSGAGIFATPTLHSTFITTSDPADLAEAIHRHGIADDDMLYSRSVPGERDVRVHVIARPHTGHALSNRVAGRITAAASSENLRIEFGAHEVTPYRGFIDIRSQEGDAS